MASFFDKFEKFRFFLNIKRSRADDKSSIGAKTCKTKMIEAVTVQTLNPNWVKRTLEFLCSREIIIQRGSDPEKPKGGDSGN
ncbi:MAG: hypothetical protein Q4A17_11660 [Thermoguttaceae bacterium]|nr:hypothetical protein [Thermoguttaceae bacterium]MDO4858587.1 hypothetical protein [Thermoguttaceae bacterium]